jgi:hypothetical protein
MAGDPRTRARAAGDPSTTSSAAVLAPGAALRLGPSGLFLHLLLLHSLL